MECQKNCSSIQINNLDTFDNKVCFDPLSLFVYDQASVNTLYTLYQTCFEKQVTQLTHINPCSIDFLYTLDKITFYLNVFKQFLDAYLLTGNDNNLKEYIQIIMQESRLEYEKNIFLDSSITNKIQQNYNFIASDKNQFTDEQKKYSNHLYSMAKKMGSFENEKTKKQLLELSKQMQKASSIIFFPNKVRLF